jgi:hypothetical protein
MLCSFDSMAYPRLKTITLSYMLDDVNVIVQKMLTIAMIATSRSSVPELPQGGSRSVDLYLTQIRSRFWICLICWCIKFASTSTVCHKRAVIKLEILR